MQQQPYMYLARVRQLSQESNRRKRAKEKKLKQRDLLEQQRRERILQQRRQQLQEATERFQRAHLASPERRRETFRRKIPTIEEALNEIQNNWSSYGHCASVEPPLASKPSRYQGDHWSDCSRSPSLSSQDSLEDEKPKPKSRHHSKSKLASANPHLMKQNNYLHSPGPATFTPVVHLSNNLNLSSKQLKQSLSVVQEPHAGKENRWLLKESNDSRKHLGNVGHSKSLKLINTQWMQQVRCPLYADEDEHKIPASLVAAKYVQEDALVSESVLESTKLASGVKDSVELAKKKAKKDGPTKAVVRKVRWNDEVNMEDKCKQQSKAESDCHWPMYPRRGPSRIPVRSPLYTQMKQGWANVGVQVNMPLTLESEVKIPPCTWSGSPKVSRKEQVRLQETEDPSVGIEVVTAANRDVGCRRTIQEGRSLSVNHTPTDDEISELWHCVRSALASKDGMFGRRQEDRKRPVVTEAAGRYKQTRMSLEEQKILLSLERLNQQLHCGQRSATTVG
ncbi:uncharacterized protein LOC128765701 [Synchiropus splendidus]|uniref:uncharacterized protein LOC128765701 n=1 Tax=Synchiropus splendidus TaxID=270530 RepID=UPI00237D9E7F|nr:uncharacterized protein LOC128765701 [Synchiropus splendidus]